MSFTHCCGNARSTSPFCRFNWFLLMPPGLNQYAWLKVSVINTQAGFSGNIIPLRLLICTWITSSMDWWWVHVAGNQPTSTAAVMLTERSVPEARGARGTFVTVAPDMGTTVTHTGDEWRGCDLGGDLSLLALLLLCFHLTTPPFILSLQHPPFLFPGWWKNIILCQMNTIFTHLIPEHVTVPASCSVQHP